MDLEDRKNDKLLFNLLVPILENEEILKMFHSVNIHDSSLYDCTNG